MIYDMFFKNLLKMCVYSKPEIKSLKKIKMSCKEKIKREYKVWPSARASQALAKCRKSHGDIRHGTAGKSLRRWEREKWVNKKTGKPCGSGGRHPYCRPSHRVSSKTPTQYKGAKLKSMISKKNHGVRASGTQTSIRV